MQRRIVRIEAIIIGQEKIEEKSAKDLSGIKKHRCEKLRILKKEMKDYNTIMQKYIYLFIKYINIKNIYFYIFIYIYKMCKYIYKK